MNKSITLAFLLSFAVQVYGQWPLYRIYQVKGNVKLQKSGTAALQPASKSTFIYDGDKLILENADVILFDRDTNYIRVMQNGQYSTKQIHDLEKIHAKDNITIKYIALLWEDLFKTEQRPGTFHADEVANSTGGVSRGLIQFISPGLDVSTSLDEQLFKWKKVNGVKTYTLAFYDENNTIVFIRKTVDTQLLVKLKDPLMYGKSYSWSLTISGKNFNNSPGANGHLTLVNEKETLPTIEMQSPDSLNGIVHELQLADLYEKSGCTKKALSIYESLVSNNEPDPAIQRLYNSFLIRTGIKNE